MECRSIGVLRSVRIAPATACLRAFMGVRHNYSPNYGWFIVACHTDIGQNCTAVANRGAAGGGLME
jgi:hypothetical protein